MMIPDTSSPIGLNSELQLLGRIDFSAPIGSTPKHQAIVFYIEALGGGLIFALTRSRSSSLVAFLSGISPLFRTGFVSISMQEK